MANVQIRDLPDELHAELRRRAEEASTSVRGYLIELIRRDQSVPSPRAWLDEVRGRERIDLGEPAADLIRAAREERLGDGERH